MLISSYAAEECLFKMNNRKQYGGDVETLEGISPPGQLSFGLRG
jgi:hypothetical protein